MDLLTPALRAALRANADTRIAAVQGGRAEPDPTPVVKFFNPLGAAMWLATELDSDGDTLFGLADLGLGCPELGSFSLREVAAVRLPFGLGIERDLTFDSAVALSVWSEAARCEGSSAPPKCGSLGHGTRRTLIPIPIGFRPTLAVEGLRRSIFDEVPDARRVFAAQNRPRPTCRACAGPALQRRMVMKLEFIPLDKLVIGKTNMRYGKRAPDVADILPTVRKRGVLQPIIVRLARPAPIDATPNDDSRCDVFEIVAGARRFTAARIVAEERRVALVASAVDTDANTVSDDDGTALPCAILDDSDDADAVEASLIENIARLDADEVTQWQTFTRLIREGRTIDDLSSTFGLPELAIKRVLALGNLLPRIRALYAAETIDRTTVHHLTLASKSQQKAWLALADDATAHCPTGQQLKAWLFGGQSIPVRHALFDVDASGLAIVADLFGDDAYFADSDAFWVAQDAAVAARRDDYLAAGWADAVIVPPQQHFATWEHEKVAKYKFGRVYLDVRSSGEVVMHEGYLTRREAERRARGGEDATETTARTPARPELTSTLQTYVDLHRHAVVRAALLDHPGVALRLMVAHGIAGSHLFRASADPQATRNPDVRDSLDNSRAEADFDARRRAVLALLGIDAEAATVIGGTPEGASYDGALVTIFYRLLDLPDSDVMAVLGVVIGEAMASGSAIVEAVGVHIGVAMADYWTADTAFLGLVRDRAVMTALVADVAGDTVAKANSGETTATMKRIVADHIAGENGRVAVENWVPRWMAFPPAAYTDRGGVGTVAAYAKAEAGRRLAHDLRYGTPSDDAGSVPSTDAQQPNIPTEDGASPLSLAA